MHSTGPRSTAAAINAADTGKVIPFLVGGYPSPEDFVSTLTKLDQSGAPAIEIGFPFTDPIADGPIIAQAMHETLTSGFSVQALFDAVKTARPNVRCALVAMVSISIVARLGYDDFASQAASAGFDALLVPDAPIDEVEPIAHAASTHNLELSLLVAPSTPDGRATKITQACSAFTYLLARAGITGSDSRADSSAAPDLAERIAALRPSANAPIACGFGISTPQDVARVLQHADAAIVGTAIVKAMRDAPNNPSDAAQQLFTQLNANA